MSEFKRGDRVRVEREWNMFPDPVGWIGEYVAQEAHSHLHGIIHPDGTLRRSHVSDFTRILTDEEIVHQVARSHFGSHAADLGRAAIIEAFRLRDERDGK